MHALTRSGTWKSSPEEVQEAVYHAIKVGYRHIDTAFAYQNEEDVGKGIRRAIDEGLVKREDLFVTTKLWATYAERVEENLELSLKALGLDYADLYLVHWPIYMNPKGTWPFFLTKEESILTASRQSPSFPNPARWHS